MNIQAAIYGCGMLQFIADGATDADVEGLVHLLSKDGVHVQETKELGVEVGLVTERSLVKGDAWVGSINVSNNRGIDRHIVIAMTPYIGKLRTPLFVAAQVKGEDIIINHVLGAYAFPTIIFPEDREDELFRKRFPEHAARYGVQTQSPQDIATSIGIGRSWLDL